MKLPVSIEHRQKAEMQGGGRSQDGHTCETMVSPERKSPDNSLSYRGFLE
ncbi:hypothetical protein [Vibrio sp. CAU 1672]|nr:hypothetical protein [Vibrio sp. CAU 1672]